MTHSDHQRAAVEMAKNGIYSELPEINARIIDRLPVLQKDHFILSDARPIPYGSRIQLEYNGAEIGLNLYYSKKKGFSVVVDKKVPTAISDQIKTLILSGADANPISPNADEQKLSCWIGADEAGKGDYLGPLVTAAFRMSKEMAPKLREMGVRDSKNLSNAQVRKIARELFRAYPDRIGVVELPPETYNNLYERFREHGKKLNELLAWAHGKGIREVMNSDVQAVIIDKFATDRVVKKNLDPNWKIILRTKAEDNIAVAAASILARARYLFRLEKLSDQFNVKLPSGAGDATLTAVRTALKKHGKSSLAKIAKLHFKNTLKAGRLFDHADQ